jgi:hypothetical protein
MPAAKKETTILGHSLGYRPFEHQSAVVCQSPWAIFSG